MYILKSKLHNRYYAGSTKEVTNRVQEHNNGECISTRNGIPWELVHIEEFRTRAEAARKEKQVKARGIGRYLEGIKNSG